MRGGEGAVKARLGGWIRANPWTEIVCHPLLAPSLLPRPLRSERPFFSTATKGQGSDCAGTFTSPLCFQMVLFSCDTVDTQHLPRIRTLLWGSAEGRWVVCRHEERESGEAGKQRGGNLGVEGKIWILLQHLLFSCTCSLPRSSVLYVSSLNELLSFAAPSCSLTPAPHPLLYYQHPCPLLSALSAASCLQAFTLFKLFHLWVFKKLNTAGSGPLSLKSAHAQQLIQD